VLAVARAEWARAARLSSVEEVLREAIGGTLPPSEYLKRDRDVAAAREALGEASFAATGELGRRLSLAAAVAFALGETAGEGNPPRRGQEP
jgi:hypothetical protein